jgi:hypothetical protein
MQATFGFTSLEGALGNQDFVCRLSNKRHKRHIKISRNDQSCNLAPDKELEELLS